jgi:hypothetical protein
MLPFLCTNKHFIHVTLPLECLCKAGFQTHISRSKADGGCPALVCRVGFRLARRVSEVSFLQLSRSPLHAAGELCSWGCWLLVSCLGLSLSLPLSLLLSLHLDASPGLSRDSPLLLPQDT